jgi:thioredoxin reductase (NADPH)
MRASQIMQDRARRNPKIEFLVPKTVEDILVGADGKVRGALLQDVDSGERTELAAQGLFVAIGHVPNSKLFRGKLDLDPSGYILVRDGTFTSVEGVFAAGDICDKKYRQAITAAGMGCMAAIDAERWLEAQEG